MKGFFLLAMAIFLWSCAKKQVKSCLDFNGESRGWSSFYVYQINECNNLSVTIDGDRTGLDLEEGLNSIDLSKVSSELLEVKLTQYDDDANAYFDDIINNDPEVLNVWNGEEGIVEIEIVQDSVGTNPDGGPEYIINLHLRDVSFFKNGRSRIDIDNLDFGDVYVGTFLGQ